MASPEHSRRGLSFRAAEEQPAASEEITRSLGRIGDIAKRNGALAQQAGQAIDGLPEQAATLRQLIVALQKSHAA